MLFFLEIVSPIKKATSKKAESFPMKLFDLNQASQIVFPKNG